MRNTNPTSQPRPAEPAQPAAAARKTSVRINELPDSYPTAKGAAPPPIILEPVAMPVVAPAVGEPDSPALVFEDMTAPPRTRPKPSRPPSRWAHRVFWTIAALIAAAAVFLIGMAVGDRQATLRYEAALNKTEPPAVALAAKTRTPAADAKKIAEVKSPPATSKRADVAKTDAPKAAEPARTTNAVAFDTHVLPILQAKCIVCHGGRAKKGELDLQTLASLKKGGENGSAVVPGDLSASVLWEFVASNKMPPGKSGKLTADEKKVIQDWIAGGAK